MYTANGYKTCFILKQQPSFKKIIFVALSESDSPFSHDKAELMGVDYVLSKSFSPTDLKDLLQQIKQGIA